ncbi:MAG: hypothetical protein O6850_01200 [Acidobacteria bacterium]|nr:hypothetical protein [Acidobacteriota bacterium]
MHAAAAALEDLQIINQPLAAIAKREELIYVPGREKEPVRLDAHSPVLHLVQQVRDETHRFAVTFHRQRRRRRNLRTELLEIPDIGEKTAQQLLRRFGSVRNLRRQTRNALLQVVTARQAKSIEAYLNNN